MLTPAHIDLIHVARTSSGRLLLAAQGISLSLTAIMQLTAPEARLAIGRIVIACHLDALPQVRQ